MGGASIAACSPSSLVDVQAPSTRVDPSQVKTSSAALQLYNAASAWIARPLAGYGAWNVVQMDGLFTDELEAMAGFTYVDARTIFPPGTSSATDLLYTSIHQARVQAQQARQALQLYAPDAPRALQGQLFALEGYTVVWLAELYCSGIPLTTVPLDGRAQPTRGFTTQELFTRAIALFDSAIVAGADSARFVNLARVGKSRALLGLGEFATADTVVQSVPTDFVYLVQFSANTSEFNNRLSTSAGRIAYRAQDNEGGNGLVWSTDPRTAIIQQPARSGAMFWPAKYYATASGTLDPNTASPESPVRLADGLEARLIQAEAALAAGNASWLTTLNTLRATCVESATCAPVPTLTTVNLPDTLTDPGTSATRLDLVMKERAMWLYMTGHREGDLRRLAHIYRRDPATLWPTGTISEPAFPPLYRVPQITNGTSYGADMVFPPNGDEQANNPLYTGCNDRNP